MSEANIVENIGKPKGYLKCIQDMGTPKEKVLFEEPQLVVNMGSKILRDLMFGDSSGITKIAFGDMNLDPNVDDIVNVDPPVLADTALTNNLFEKAVSSSKTIYGGHYAVQYTATLAANEFNGTGEQLITEFGLFNAEDEMFSRKTRSAIFKNAESSLTFIWYLVFN